MRCECGKLLKQVNEDYQWHSLVIGEVMVPKIKVHKCGTCGAKWIGMEAAKKLEAFVKNLETSAIGDLPVKHFLTRKQTIAMLDCSVSGFKSNHRIRNGFVISHSIDGVRYYLAESVRRFKDSGDGRFNIIVEWEKVR